MTSETETTEKKPKKRRWLRTIIKIALLAAVLLFIVLTVLKNLGGADDTLKSGIEGYISEATGYTATVRTLNNVTFFPDISFDFEDLELWEDGVEYDPVALVGKIEFSTGFWDVLFGTGKIRGLYLKSAYARPGSFLDQAIAIKTLSIIETNSGEVFLEGEGAVGSNEVAVKVNIQPGGSPGRRKYKLTPDKGITLRYGPIKLEGVLDRTAKPAPVLRIEKFYKDGQAAEPYKNAITPKNWKSELESLIRGGA